MSFLVYKISGAEKKQGKVETIVSIFKKITNPCIKKNKNQEIISKETLKETFTFDYYFLRKA